jgi:hypothetical protein
VLTFIASYTIKLKYICINLTSKTKRNMLCNLVKPWLYFLKVIENLLSKLLWTILTTRALRKELLIVLYPVIHWGHNKNRQALGSAIHRYIITMPKSSYRDAFEKLIHRLKLCISSHGSISRAWMNTFEQDRNKQYISNIPAPVHKSLF